MSVKIEQRCFQVRKRNEKNRIYKIRKLHFENAVFATLACDFLMSLQKAHFENAVFARRDFRIICDAEFFIVNTLPRSHVT
jgi:hypothetical protein